jgi:hypothetical protein
LAGETIPLRDMIRVRDQLTGNSPRSCMIANGSSIHFCC